MYHVSNPFSSGFQDVMDYDEVYDLEEDLMKRKQNIAMLSKMIYRMLITPPFMVRKPTGLDFI